MPLVAPHGGGGLRARALEGEALAAEKKRAATLPKLRISSRERGDLRLVVARALARPHWDG